MEQLAGDKKCTAAQLALAWVLSRGEHIVPIPGTRQRRHLTENIGALQIQLSADEIRSLEEIFPLGAAAGARYNAQALQTVNR